MIKSEKETAAWARAKKDLGIPSWEGNLTLDKKKELKKRYREHLKG